MSATIFPGLTIFCPAQILGAAFIVIPLAAVAIVLLLVACGRRRAARYAVRGVRALVRRRAEAREQVTVEAPAPARCRAAVGVDYGLPCSARDHCLAPERVDAPIYGGRYRPLFADLPPLGPTRRAARARPAGWTVRPRRGLRRRGLPLPAVWPFFGQFVAHDITADRSPLVHRADPARLRNFRIPKANLEGVYGAGPVGSPYLYGKDDPAKLLLSPSGSDVPRNQEGIALIGDPRNDVHLFTSQMLVAFIELHNRLVDRLRDDGVAEQDVSTRRGGRRPGTTST